MTNPLQPFTDVRCRLGEAPLWHHGIGRLFWFDILAPAIHSCGVDGSSVESIPLAVTASAAMIETNETLLLATERGVERWSIGTGAMELLASVEEQDSSTRSNDGVGGVDGAFYFSTMGWRSEEKLGSIYRYDPSGAVVPLLRGLTIPNSLAFSADGSRFYHTDSPTGALRCATNGPITEEDPIVHDLRDEAYVSDGTIIDSEDHLWTCHWDGGDIVRITPEGEVVERLTVPTGRPTRACLGGPDLRTLYVATAVGDLADKPNEDAGAGRMFATHVEVSGRPESIFGGP